MTETRALTLVFDGRLVKEMLYPIVDSVVDDFDDQLEGLWQLYGDYLHHRFEEYLQGKAERLVQGHDFMDEWAMTYLGQVGVLGDYLLGLEEITTHHLGAIRHVLEPYRTPTTTLIQVIADWYDPTTCTGPALVCFVIGTPAYVSAPMQLPLF